MRIIYTKHAQEQIEERKINYLWVENTIKNPDFTERRVLTKYLARKKLNGKSLEAVYVKERYIKIITVYWV